MLFSSRYYYFRNAVTVGVLLIVHRLLLTFAHINGSYVYMYVASYSYVHLFIIGNVLLKAVFNWTNHHQNVGKNLVHSYI